MRVIAATDMGADSAATTDVDTTPPVEDPVDESTKEDKSSKRDRSGSSLKKSSFGTPAVVATPSAKEYKFERVCSTQSSLVGRYGLPHICLVCTSM